MINEELINQEFLAEEIKSLEKGYVETVINLIKWPILMETCSKALLEAEWEKKTALERTIALHESNYKTNNEAVEQLNRIITEAKKLIK